MAMTKMPPRVFGASVAVGGALGAGATREGERDEQRYGCERVRDVVEGIAKQGHGAGQHNNDGLDRGGQPESTEADEEGPSSGGVCFEGVVDLIGCVVGVAALELRQLVPNACPEVGRVIVIVVVVRVVIMPMIVASGPLVVVLEVVRHNGRFSLRWRFSCYLICADANVWQ
jgi:hypothetical protein